EYELARPGLKSLVRVDAFSDRPLTGHVKNVATVASQQDWMTADVKVYQTIVGIDVPLKKPKNSKLDTADSGDGDAGPAAAPAQSEDKNALKEGDLKPGMSAEVTILVENAHEKVLTIPIAAIIGGAENGLTRKVYIKTETGPVERDIMIGLSNDRMA